MEKRTNVCIFNKYAMQTAFEFTSSIEEECEKINKLSVDELTIDSIELAKINLANITNKKLGGYGDNTNKEAITSLQRKNLIRMFSFLDRKKIFKNLIVYPFLDRHKQALEYFDETKYYRARAILIKEMPEKYEILYKANTFRELAKLCLSEEKGYLIKEYRVLIKFMTILDKHNIFIINELYSYDPNKPKRLPRRPRPQKMV